MNELHPRRVEDGALRRWLKEALELTKRRFWLWLLASLLFSVLCALGMLSGLALLSVVGLIAAGTLGAAGGVLIAAYADRRLKFGDLLRALRGPEPRRYTLRVLPHTVWHNGFLVLISGIIGVIGIISPLFIGVIGSAPIPFPAATVPGLLSLSVFGLIGFAMHVFTTNDHPATHLHRFLIMALLNVSWEGSAVLIARGYLLNFKTMERLRSNFMPPYAMLMLFYFIPFGDVLLTIAGLVVFPFGSSLLYVSFRDIYLGVAENNPVRAPERQAAPAPAQS